MFDTAGKKYVASCIPKEVNIMGEGENKKTVLFGGLKPFEGC